MVYYILFQSLTLLSSLGLMFLLFYVWRYRYAKGANALLLLIFSTFIWAVCSFFQTANQTVEGQFLVFKITQLGIMFIPSAWLLFTINYTSRERGITGWLTLPFFVFPIVILAIVWSPVVEDLYVSAADLIETGPFLVLKVQPEPLYWVAATHNYALIGLGAFILMKRLFSGPGATKKQILLVLVAVFLPLLCDVIYTFDMFNFPRVEITPVTFTISVLLITLGLVRYKLFMVLPFAREHIVRSLTDGILIFDTEARLTEINRTAEKLLTITTQTVGKKIGEIPEISSIFGKLNATGQCLLKLSLTETEEEKLVEAEVIPLNDEKGYSVGLLITLHDITERKQMLDRINAEDRLASIGKLTAGVAHEINNPLAVIKGLAELMMDSDIDDETKKDVIVINEEVDRVSKVIENLLTFARQQTGEKKRVDINAIITRTVRLMSYGDDHSGVEIITDLSEALPEVLGNETQLRQVFVNIISNAEDSIRNVNGNGILKIITNESGGRANIRITDNGPGIPEKDIRHIFDPFFTTSFKDNASGLGLSICHGIISEHGGEISVESIEGKGTTFIINLPAFMESDAYAEEIDVAEMT